MHFVLEKNTVSHSSTIFPVMNDAEPVYSNQDLPYATCFSYLHMLLRSSCLDKLSWEAVGRKEQPRPMTWALGSSWYCTGPEP